MCVLVILLAYNACSSCASAQEIVGYKIVVFVVLCSTDGMTFCLHCSYIPLSLNNKELKSFKLKRVISVMPIKPARAFQREGDWAIKARENA